MEDEKVKRHEINSSALIKWSQDKLELDPNKLDDFFLGPVTKA